MKKNIKAMISLVSVAAMAALIFGGCARSGNNAGPASDHPTPENPLTLKLSMPFPEIIDIGEGYIKAAEMIKEGSGGALELKIYADGTLLAFDDTFQGVSTGVADIGWIAPANIDSNLPLNRVFSMTYPYVPGDIFVQRNSILEAYDKIPQLSEELAKFNLVLLDAQTCSPCVVATNKTSVRTMNDIRGLKLNTIGIASDYFASLGAAAVTISAGDYYLSMERGVIDGMYDGVTTFHTFQMMSLVNNILVFGSENKSNTSIVNGMSACPNPTVMNLDTWSKLSPEQQALLKNSIAFGVEQVTMTIYDADTKKAIKEFEDSGVVFTFLEGNDLKPWVEAQAPVLQQWIDDTTALGYPAREVYDAVNRIYDSAK
ncbi:MAG: TRAP transporter substrate-binding protein DctP [Oscillospiraceae bacterium]|nr:TRAP transporter substrate-binding protein DctP [Oscillospiraceae bacterium]